LLDSLLQEICIFMMLFSLTTVFSLLVVGLTSAKVTYHGHQVHRVNVENEEHASFLENLKDVHNLDFWAKPRVGHHADIMVPPHLKTNIEDTLKAKGLKSSVMISDVEELIQKQLIPANSTRQFSGHSMDWTSYHTLEDIYGWFDYLETTYEFCESEIIGQSYEGQDMRVMKVCKGGCGNKPAMWIDSGIHAREWISPATGTWMLNEVVENDAAHPDLTENLDWYFLPVHNPDGYRKSIDDDRMWRKTTTQYPGNACQGTDANRNFDYHWAENGASSDSCSQTYQGPEAFSEVEARNVRDWVLARKDSIKFFQSLHSYSQLILIPWGYTTETAPGYYAMLDMAMRGYDALHAVHGKVYEVGCVPCVLYTAAGISVDWALGVAGIPYVYTIELRDTGAYGFLLPPEQIIPTAEETWAFHEVAARQIMVEFGS